MSYFTAVLARDGRAWTFHDLDVDSQSSLTELTADLRGVAEDDQPVLLLVEREDAWWAVVRVDGDDDPRVFVSDLAGAVASPYAELLAVADEEDENLAPGVCGGDLDLLSDLGTSPESLREMCDDQLLPMDALAAVAEAGGFAEQLDSLR
ncbi:MAG TPA: tRNA adenosine deaminase-associated protein [Actinomycetes bacterium]|nr:tRNA adenosine deaminase-associated protein [Actinomycetes bacterium]